MHDRESEARKSNQDIESGEAFDVLVFMMTGFGWSGAEVISWNGVAAFGLSLAVLSFDAGAGSPRR